MSIEIPINESGQHYGRITQSIPNMNEFEQYLIPAYTETTLHAHTFLFRIISQVLCAAKNNNISIIFVEQITVRIEATNNQMQQPQQEFVFTTEDFVNWLNNEQGTGTQENFNQIDSILQDPDLDELTINFDSEIAYLKNLCKTEEELIKFGRIDNNVDCKYPIPELNMIYGLIGQYIDIYYMCPDCPKKYKYSKCICSITDIEQVSDQFADYVKQLSKTNLISEYNAAALVQSGVITNPTTDASQDFLAQNYEPRILAATAYQTDIALESGMIQEIPLNPPGAVDPLHQSTPLPWTDVGSNHLELEADGLYSITYSGSLEVTDIGAISELEIELGLVDDTGSTIAPLSDLSMINIEIPVAADLSISVPFSKTMIYNTSSSQILQLLSNYTESGASGADVQIEYLSFSATKYPDPQPLP